MTVQTVNVSTLKRVKNNVIGNLSANLVKALNAPDQFEDAAGPQDNIRVEAAHVITSLSYGTQSLLRTALSSTNYRSPFFLY
ncbi:hypothetical protein V8E52_009206 [Russula decolorans]